MAIYLKINGIQGSVTTSGYTGCIEVIQYFEEGLRQMTQRPATSGDRTIGPLSFNSLILRKPFDSATPELTQYFYKASVLPEIVFNHLSAGGSGQCYLINTFKNVMISRYTSLMSSEGIVEELELHFTVQQKAVRNLSAGHSAGAQKVIGFDSAQAKSL